jgi:hypothetical protein
MKSNLLIPFMYGCAFDVMSKKFLSNPGSQIISSMFFSINFIVLGFEFRSMINFEFFFI